MKKSTTASMLLAMILVMAVPHESKAITIDDIRSVARNTSIIPPEIRGWVTTITDLFYSNNSQNAAISPGLLNSVLTQFGISGGSNGLNLGGSSGGNQPLSTSNLMDFAGLSQLSNIGLPKNSNATAGNTDSLLSALTVNFAAATANGSKTQVEESAKAMGQTASSVAAVINTDEIDPQSSLEMLRKMGQELQANGQMIQSSAAVQVAQAKIDANRYNLEAANLQQKSYKDLQEKRYIDKAALAHEKVMQGAYHRYTSSDPDATPTNGAIPTIASSSVFGQ